MANDDEARQADDEDELKTWLGGSGEFDADADATASGTAESDATRDATAPSVGRLRLDRVVGRGGMGRVWEAYDEVLDRRVAVKAIRRARRLEAHARLRFLREARILSQLDHPGICRLHDLVEEDGHQYLVLEYIDGTTLAEQDYSELSRRQKLEIGRRIAQALAAAHEKGVAHLDLKPSNVMLTLDGRVKILDFGIAQSLRGRGKSEDASGAVRSTSDTTTVAQSGSADGSLAAVGTISHMSPEQACQEPVGPGSDLYSLGILLQEMLTGRPAYPPTRGQAARLVRVANADTVAPEDLPKELAQLLGQLLRQEPGARPSAADVVRRIEHVLDAPARRRRRQRLAAGAAFGTVVVALLVLGVYHWASGRPEPSLLSPDGGARIVIPPFVAVTAADAPWIELGLRDLVASSLERIDGVEVVDLRTTQSVLGRRNVKDLDIESLAELARKFSADFTLAAQVDDDSGSLSYIIARRDGSARKTSLVAADGTRAAEELVARLERRLASAEADPADMSSMDDGLTRSVFADDPLTNRVYALGSALLARGESEASIHFFRVCLQLTPSFDLARLRLASAIHRARGAAEAKPAVEDVVNRSRDAGDEVLLGHALRQRAWIAAWFGKDYDSSRRDLEEALEIARRRGGLSEGRVMRALASVAGFQGRVKEAERRLIEAEEIALRVDSVDLLQSVYFERGIVASEAGRPEESAVWFGKSLQKARELGAEAEIARTINSLGVVADERGELEEARDRFLEAASIHQRLGNQHSRALGLANAGGMTLRLGDLETAESQLLEASKLSEETSYDRGFDELCDELLLVSLTLERSAADVQVRRELCDGHLVETVARLVAAALDGASSAHLDELERLVPTDDWPHHPEHRDLFLSVVDSLR